MEEDPQKAQARSISIPGDIPLPQSFWQLPWSPTKQCPQAQVACAPEGQGWSLPPLPSILLSYLPLAPPLEVVAAYQLPPQSTLYIRTPNSPCLVVSFSGDLGAQLTMTD